MYPTRYSSSSSLPNVRPRPIILSKLSPSLPRLGPLPPPLKCFKPIEIKVTPTTATILRRALLLPTTSKSITRRTTTDTEDSTSGGYDSPLDRYRDDQTPTIPVKVVISPLDLTRKGIKSNSDCIKSEEEEKRLFCLFCPTTFSVKQLLETREHYIDHFVALDTISNCSTSGTLKRNGEETDDSDSDSDNEVNEHDSNNVNNNSCEESVNDPYNNESTSTGSAFEDHNYHWTQSTSTYVHHHQDVDIVVKANPRENNQKKKIVVSKRVNKYIFDWISRFVRYQINLIKGQIKLPSTLFKDCLVCESIAVVHKLPVSRIRFYRKRDFERHFRSHLKYGVYFCKLCRDYSRDKFYRKWLLKLLAVPWTSSSHSSELSEEEEEEDVSKIYEEKESADETERKEAPTFAPSSSASSSFARSSGPNLRSHHKQSVQPSPGQSTSAGSKGKEPVIKYRKIKEATKFSASRTYKPHYEFVLRHIRGHHLCKRNKLKKKVQVAGKALPIDSVIGTKTIPVLEQMVNVHSGEHVECLKAMKVLGLRPDPSQMALTGDRRHFYTITEDDWMDIMEVIEMDKENERLLQLQAERSSTSSGFGSSASTSTDTSPDLIGTTGSSTSNLPQTSTGLTTTLRGLSIWSRKRNPNSLLADDPTPTSTRSISRRRRIRLMTKQKMTWMDRPSAPPRLRSHSLSPVFGSEGASFPCKRRTNNSMSISTSPSAARRRLFFDNEKCGEDRNLPETGFGQALASGDLQQQVNDCNNRKRGRPVGTTKANRRSAADGGNGCPVPGGDGDGCDDESRHSMVTRRRMKSVSKEDQKMDESKDGRSKRCKKSRLQKKRGKEAEDEPFNDNFDPFPDDDGQDLNNNVTNGTITEFMDMLLSIDPAELLPLCPKMVSNVLKNAESSESHTNHS